MTINFDMDGTLADLYSVENWIDYLEAEDSTPYEIAKPLFNMQALARVLNRLHRDGVTINIISWCSKNASYEYREDIRRAKCKWLANHLASVQFDHIFIVPYGTPKELCADGVLFDDEERNRKAWDKGEAYDVTDIISVLKTL